MAILSAACWSIVTPPFQVPDEPDHFAYVKALAHGALPTSRVEPSTNDPELVEALADLNWYKVRQAPRTHTIFSAAKQRQLESGLSALTREPQQSSGAAGVATSQPPLYYALALVPYSFASNVLTRLMLMRLLSVLLAGVTVLFTFMFVRESMPRTPWTWTTAGLATALVPLFGQMSGAVNPDALLFTISAGVFFCLARAFRRGFTQARAIALGALVALGLMTKLNFIGLLPGVLLALVVLTLRARRIDKRQAWRAPALACGIGFAPVALYAVINAFSSHATFGEVSNLLNGTHTSAAELSYIWQLFLPRLPSMHDYFPGLSMTGIWFRAYVGLYGWLDTTFPGWVYEAALVPAAALLVLFARGLLGARAELRAHAAELVVYAAMTLGLPAIIGIASWSSFPYTAAEFSEPRYLLPLLPLLGVGLALAARGAGRRYGPVVAVAIVMLFLAHDLFSQLLVAARFYG